MTGITGAVMTLHLVGVLALTAAYFTLRRRRFTVLWTATAFNALVMIAFFTMGAWLAVFVPALLLGVAQGALLAHRSVERKFARQVTTWARERSSR